MADPHHIEITSPKGATKWVHNIVSHTPEEIREAWEGSELVTLVDHDGCETSVDFDEVFVVRFQDEAVFRRRSKEIKGNGRSRRRSQPVRRRGYPPEERE